MNIKIENDKVYISNKGDKEPIEVDLYELINEIMKTHLRELKGMIKYREIMK
jgi:hypothetical protein